MWLGQAILAASAWALGGVLLKPASKKYHTVIIYALNSFSFLSIWIVYKALTQSIFFIPNWIIIFLALIPPLAFICFVTALSKGKVSVVTAVSSVSPLISSSLGFFVLKETFTPYQLLLTILIIILIIALGRLEHSSNIGSTFSGFIWGLATAVGFGLANFVGKISMSVVNTTTYSILVGSWMSLIAIFWLLKTGVKTLPLLEILKSKTGALGIIGSYIYSFGGFFLYFALATGPLTVVVPVSNLSTPLTLILATIILKEKINLRAKLLIGLIFLTTTLLAMANA